MCSRPLPSRLSLGGHRRGPRHPHRDCQSRARRCAAAGAPRTTATPPPYERLSGKFYGELDPADPKNALITDIQLAPRNARGKVEYVGTFSLMKPVDLSKASGVLMYSVVNRGNGSGGGEPGGPHLARQRLAGRCGADRRPTRRSRCLAPETRTAAASPARWSFASSASAAPPRALIIPRGDPVPVSAGDARHDEGDAGVGRVGERRPASRAGVVNDRGDRLGVRDVREDAVSRHARSGAHLPEERLQPRSALRAAVHRQGSARARHRVRGHARSSTRFSATNRRMTRGRRIRWPERCAGRSRRAARNRAPSCARSSGSGSTRTRRGRIVWDGSNPNIASRVLDMNRRFALPGGDVEFYELGTEAPVWWEDWNDAPRGRGTSGLLDRCRATNSVPEDHGNVRQRRDLEPARVVHAGRHRRQGRHSAAGQRAPLLFRRRHARRRPRRIQQRRRRRPTAASCRSNPAPSAPMRSALTKAFVAWVTTGTAMPPSRYPTIADGTLVPGHRRGDGVSGDSRETFTCHLVHPLLDYDLGPRLQLPGRVRRSRPRCRRSSGRCRSSSSRSMRMATKWPA